MNSAAVADLERPVCPNCRIAIPEDRWNAKDAFCSGCRAPMTALVFPALFHRMGPAAAVAAEEGEASCFYHAAKKATVACDQCGRFLCGLCHVEFQGSNWCPSCIESRREKGKLSSLETRRVLYDTLALLLVTLPVIWPFTFLTIISAPVALFIVIRYWMRPSSIVARSKIRLYVALVLAILEIGGWVWIGAFLVSRL